MKLWPWITFGCLVCILNPILGALILFPPITIWVQRQLDKPS